MSSSWLSEELVKSGYPLLFKAVTMPLLNPHPAAIVQHRPLDNWQKLSEPAFPLSQTKEKNLVTTAMMRFVLP